MRSISKWHERLRRYNSWRSRCSQHRLREREACKDCARLLQTGEGEVNKERAYTGRRDSQSGHELSVAAKHDTCMANDKCMRAHIDPSKGREVCAQLGMLLNFDVPALMQ